jgi:hypothetical protein
MSFSEVIDSLTKGARADASRFGILQGAPPQNLFIFKAVFFRKMHK